MSDAIYKTSAFASRVRKSMRTRSPVFRSARLPPAPPERHRGSRATLRFLTVGRRQCKVERCTNHNTTIQPWSHFGPIYLIYLRHPRDAWRAPGCSYPLFGAERCNRRPTALRTESPSSTTAIMRHRNGRTTLLCTSHRASLASGR
jgi:hypothetical protein